VRRPICRSPANCLVSGFEIVGILGNPDGSLEMCLRPVEIVERE
jgi:hypothetical protein